MKIAFQLAWRNLKGAGIRTWLNVGVLAFTFLLILFYNGYIEGWNNESARDQVEWEFGYGHLINDEFNENDPFTIKDGNGKLKKEYQTNLSPILIQQGTIYPDGREIPILIKGIDIDQTILSIPVQSFKSDADMPQIAIGQMMAQNNHLEEGDRVLMRWRDKNGTFDAMEMEVVEVFNSMLMSIEKSQVWMPIEQLQNMTGLEGHATYWVANEEYQPKEISGWTFSDQDKLLEGFRKIIASKKVGGSIMYVLLLAISLLAIFDTQVLSIFRRQKEIGTYISLGMTRWAVVKLFTLEGVMYSLLATVVAAIIGIPLFYWMNQVGIPVPDTSRGTSIPLGERIYPIFPLVLIVGTLITIVIASTIVSYLPSRKIARMDPVLALKGKIQ